GGFVHDRTGSWRLPFFIVGLPGLAVALAALAIPEPERGAAEDVSAEQRQRHQALPFSWRLYVGLLRNPSYVCNTLGMALWAFALGGLQIWGAKFFENRGAPQPGLWLGPVLAVSGLVGTFVGGWLGDRLSRRWTGAYFWVSGVTMIAAVPFIVPAL